MKSKGFRETAEGVYFWGSLYSNWYITHFVIDGVTYNCVEQYMMAQKAIMANDKESLEKIMNVSDPGEQKKLGQAVANLNVKEWDEKKLDIVTKGCIAKFTSKRFLQETLLKTGNKVIVEGSPNDRLWGVGLHWSSSDIEDKNKWKGTNLLGRALMKAREEIRNNIK